MPSRYFVPSTSTFREGFEKLLDAGLFHEIADHLDAGEVGHRAAVAQEAYSRITPRLRNMQIVRLASSCRFFQSLVSRLYFSRVVSCLAKYVKDVP